MARWRWLLSAALVASAISSVATAQAQEEDNHERPVSLDQIPAPARDQILREVGTGSLMEVVEGTFHGQPAYEGMITKGSRNVMIWVDAGGNILDRHLTS